MNTEREIQAFWEAHPCGQNVVAGHERGLYDAQFDQIDDHRYRTEHHILGCLDELKVAGERVLEIGLGQASDGEQLIRRGADWSGVDLTEESVRRVQLRLQIRGLPYHRIAHGGVLALPWDDGQFDTVHSLGVLHHVPDILGAPAEIARVLRPGGRLVAMVYAKRSLNDASIAVVRRLALVGLLAAGHRGRGLVGRHLKHARREGWKTYLSMGRCVHANTDGPDNPYSKVYRKRYLERDFPAFHLERVHRVHARAPAARAWIAGREPSRLASVGAFPKTLSRSLQHHEGSYAHACRCTSHVRHRGTTNTRWW